MGDTKLTIDKSKYGGFNDAPPNFREISEKEFAQSKFFIYTPKSWEYRQIHRKEDLDRLQRTSMLAIRMVYFYDGTGIAMEGDRWAGKVRYFSFALCEHRERTEKKVGRYLHEYTCKKCGYKEIRDGKRQEKNHAAVRAKSKSAASKRA